MHTFACFAMCPSPVSIHLMRWKRFPIHCHIYCMNQLKRKLIKFSTTYSKSPTIVTDWLHAMHLNRHIVRPVLSTFRTIWMRECRRAVRSSYFFSSFFHNFYSLRRIKKSKTSKVRLLQFVCHMNLKKKLNKNKRESSFKWTSNDKIIKYI